MGKLVNGIIAAIATLFIMAGISMPALAATDDTYVPKNDSAGNIFVQDQANVLSAETEKHVYDLNKSWESREDKPQLLVVTVSTLDGVPIERKAKELFDRYKPGMKGKNTGLVYLLSIKDHKDRLTVGTGIGQTFNQSTCESIINSGHADYKKSYWNAGISKVLDNIASTVQDMPEISSASTSATTPAPMPAWIEVLGVVIVVVGSVLLLIWGLQSDDKSEQTDYSELDNAQRDHSELDNAQRDHSEPDTGRAPLGPSYIAEAAPSRGFDARDAIILTQAVALASRPDRQEHDRSSENDSINDDSWPYTGPSPSFDSSSSFGGGTSTGSGATGSW